MNKPKILVTVLCGTERTNWINPDLLGNIVCMCRDPRFETSIFPVRDHRPVEVARNVALDTARKLGVDWCLQLDCDNFTQFNPLDVIAQATEAQRVIVLDYAECSGADRRFGLFANLVPNGETQGRFREVYFGPGGCLFVHRSVWEQIPAPWFKWEHGTGPLLMQGILYEDVYLSKICAEHGIKTWAYEHPAGHFRTTDLTAMVSTFAQLNGGAR
jgi:hypothetical protein